MFNGEGNENGKKLSGQISKKNKNKQTTLLVTAHFFVHFFVVVVAT